MNIRDLVITVCDDCEKVLIPDTEDARWCCGVWRCFSCWNKHIAKEL